MPKYKYFDEVSEIHHMLESDMRQYEIEQKYGSGLDALIQFPGDAPTLESTIEEMQAGEYLFALYHDSSRETVYKPSIEVFQRMFTRHKARMEYLIQLQGRLKVKTSTTTDDHDPVIAMYHLQIITCNYYLTLIKETDYFERMPETIHPPKIKNGKEEL